MRKQNDIIDCNTSQGDNVKLYNNKKKPAYI